MHWASISTRSPRTRGSSMISGPPRNSASATDAAKILLVASALAFLGGCGPPPPAPLPPLKALPIRPKSELTEAEVIKIAQDQARSQGCVLTEYKAPEVEFHGT